MTKKAMRGVVVNGDMVSGDAMGGTCEAPQFLDIHVQQIARSGVLVTQNDRLGIEVADAADAEPAQNAADRGVAQTHLPNNAETGPALAKCLNELNQLGRGGTMELMRPRAAVRQAAPVRRYRPAHLGAAFNVHPAQRTFFAKCSGL